MTPNTDRAEASWQSITDAIGAEGRDHLAWFVIGAIVSARRPEVPPSSVIAAAQTQELKTPADASEIPGYIWRWVLAIDKADLPADPAVDAGASLLRRQLALFLDSLPPAMEE